MKSPETTVGLLAPSGETRERLRAEVKALDSAALELEVDQYCRSYGDRPTLRFMENRPEIIIIDMEDTRAAIQCLEILHAALPESWLLVTSQNNDPDLIIETMRAGAREYLLWPMQAGALSQAVARFRAETERKQQKSTGQIHCVTAAKGGSGATSVTINVARSLADLPNTRVALIDLNSPLGDAAAYLNLRPEFTASDVLEAASRLDAVLLESYMSNAEGLAVLPGPKEFWKELPPGVAPQAPGINALAQMLQIAGHAYDYAIIDLASSLEKTQMQVVIGTAASVVVVLTPELPALWRTRRLFNFLEACGGKEKVRLVVNRSRRTDEITEAEIEKTLNHPVFWKLPNDYNASIEAINSGKPLVSTNHAELSRGYRELAHRLAGIPVPKKRLGIFRLFSSNRRN